MARGWGVLLCIDIEEGGLLSPPSHSKCQHISHSQWEFSIYCASFEEIIKCATLGKSTVINVNNGNMRVSLCSPVCSPSSHTGSFVVGRLGQRGQQNNSLMFCPNWKHTAVRHRATQEGRQRFIICMMDLKMVTVSFCAGADDEDTARD